MKLTILGSGTAVPNGERNSAGYFVEAGKARLMLDCGAGTLHAMARYDVDWQNLTHIFISHFHVDHIGELASLFFAFRNAMKIQRSEPLTLIAPHGIDLVIEHLKAAFGEKLFHLKFPFHLQMVKSGESLQINDECVLSFAKTPHTDESLALRIQQGERSMAYTGDTDYSQELEPFFQGVNLLISECSFRQHKEGVKHLAVKDVARLAEQARVENLLVTHFYFDVDEENLKKELQATYAGNIIVGKDGMRLVL
jgi:ribonuclease BN (tRNA processing enzyme)